MGNAFSCCFPLPNDQRPTPEIQNRSTEVTESLEPGDDRVDFSAAAKRREKRRAKRLAKKTQKQTVSETTPLLQTSGASSISHLTPSVVRETRPIADSSPSDSDITAYIQYAWHERTKYKDDKKLQFLADQWTTVIHSLNSSTQQLESLSTADNGHFLSLSNLRVIERSPHPNEIIEHCLMLGRSRFPTLVDIAQYHLTSFRQIPQMRRVNV